MARQPSLQNTFKILLAQALRARGLTAHAIAKAMNISVKKTNQVLNNGKTAANLHRFTLDKGLEVEITKMVKYKQVKYYIRDEKTLEADSIIVEYPITDEAVS